MAIGLRLRVTNTTDGNVLDRTFDRYPVRIGRNPLSDLQLNFPFVSQFHAVLDLQGNKLILTDLGSRNGTHLRASGRVPPNTPIDLQASNYEFAISHLLFQAFSVEVHPESVPLRMRGASFVLEDRQEAPRAAQTTVDAVLKLRPLHDAYRAAWTQFHQGLAAELARLSPPERHDLVNRLLRDHPGLGDEPDLQNLLASHQLPVPKPEVSRDQSVLVQAVKDLARSFVPSRTIESTSDMVIFLTKLQAAMDVFLKSFIPMRDGHKQFEFKMDIRRHTGQTATGGTAMAVGQAGDPAALATALFDWRDATDEGPRALQSIFAALMVHQVALLDGVMRGVKVLLHELSPATIEQTAERKNRLTWGPFAPSRWESLWKVFVERHGDLADEEKETFELIFGPEFVSAYNQFTRESKVGQPAAGQTSFEHGSSYPPGLMGHGGEPPKPRG